MICYFHGLILTAKSSEKINELMVCSLSNLNISVTILNIFKLQSRLKRIIGKCGWCSKIADVLLWKP